MDELGSQLLLRGSMAQPPHVSVDLRLDMITGLAFSRTGELVVASMNGSVDMMNPITAVKKTVSFDKVFDSLRCSCVDVSRDGRFVCIGSNQGVFTWCPPLNKLRGTKDILWRSRQSFQNVVNVAISPDGDTVVASSSDRATHLFDIKNGNILATIANFRNRGYRSSRRDVNSSVAEGYIIASVFDPMTKDDVLLATSNGCFAVWDVQQTKYNRTNQQSIPMRNVLNISRAPLTCMAVSRFGRFVGLGSSNHHIFIVKRSMDLRSQRTGGTARRFVLEGHRDRVSCLSFLPKDDRILVSGSWDRSIRVWDAIERKSLHVIAPAHGYHISSLSFSRKHVLLQGEKSWVFATGSLDKTVRIWNYDCLTNPDNQGSIVRASDTITCLSFSPSGVLVACGTQLGNLQIWDPANLQTHQQPSFSISSGTTEAIQVLAFSRRAGFVIAGTTRGWIHIFDVNARSHVYCWSASSASVVAVALSFDSQTMGVGTDGSSLLIWHCKDRLPRHQVNLHQRNVSAISFSPNGHFLAAATLSKNVNIYNVVTADLVFQLQNFPKLVYTMCFTDESNSLACVLRDGKVSINRVSRVWPPRDSAPAEQVVSMSSALRRLKSNTFTHFPMKCENHTVHYNDKHFTFTSAVDPRLALLAVNPASGVAPRNNDHDQEGSVEHDASAFRFGAVALGLNVHFFQVPLTHTREQ